MDDEAVFGPQVHTLGLQEAIDRGLLAPFEIAVLELRDPATHPGLVKRLPLPWGAGSVRRGVTGRFVHEGGGRS